MLLVIVLIPFEIAVWTEIAVVKGAMPVVDRPPKFKEYNPPTMF